MDYKNIHARFIEYFKMTTPLMRLVERDPDDIRLFCGGIYTENHHIIPKAEGGSDDSINIVSLLPEEHLFIHKLRYKAYGKRCDMLAVRIILNGFKNPNNKKHIDNLRLSKTIINGYAWIRTNSSKFRKTVGWHTKEGVKRISNARKGKVPVKHHKTGEIIGMVDIDHPKYKSGEYVHSSSGKRYKQRTDVVSKKRGSGNPNYSGVSDKEILEHAISFYKNRNIWKRVDWLEYCRNNGIPIMIKTRFDNGGYMKLLDLLREEFGELNRMTQKNPEYRKKISESLKNRKWFTNTKTGESILVSLDDKGIYWPETHPDYVKGRTNAKNRKT